MNDIQRVIKRVMDIIGALVGIVLCLPALAAVAVAIKIFDGGPLLFRQILLGRDGRPFLRYRFRSMCVDAESKWATLEDRNELDGPVFKVKDDPRITPVGRLIRRYNLDELPELFNVLLGDMSLVGPRPQVPSEATPCFLIASMPLKGAPKSETVGLEEAEAIAAKSSRRLRFLARCIPRSHPDRKNLFEALGDLREEAIEMASDGFSRKEIQVAVRAQAVQSFWPLLWRALKKGLFFGAIISLLGKA